MPQTDNCSTKPPCSTQDAPNTPAVLVCDASERWYRNDISSNAEASSSNKVTDTNTFTHMDRKVRHMRYRMTHSSRGRVYYAPKSAMPLVHDKKWTRTYTTSSALRTSKWNGVVNSRNSTNAQSSLITRMTLSDRPDAHSMLYVLTYDLPINTMTTSDLSLLKTTYSIQSSIAVWMNGTWTQSDVIQQRVSPRRAITSPAPDTTDTIDLRTFWLSSLASVLQSRSLPLYSTRCTLEQTLTSS